MMPNDESKVREIMRLHGVGVMIPTYNNGQTLEKVIQDVRRYCQDIIVVNDGSTDLTSEILAKYQPEVQVITHDKNLGKGTALKHGLKEAQSCGWNYAITLDSDGQHYADELPEFLEAIINHPGNLIVGSRNLKGKGQDAKSSFANKFANFWFCAYTGQHIRDTQSGYRAYPLRHFKGVEHISSRYEAELELLVMAAWQGIGIKEIPIKVYYPPKEQRVSHFRPGRDFARISVVNTLLFPISLLYGYPSIIFNAIKHCKWFGKEFKPFTHKRGRRREASITLRRIGASVYTGMVFVFFSVCVIRPLTFFWFKIGKNSDRKIERYHVLIQTIGKFLSRAFPDASVKISNPHQEDFTQPAVVICNHQSNMDLPVIMGVSPKLVFVTNEWVWDNAFFGQVVRRAGYIRAADGPEKILEKSRQMVAKGYSIMIFPEGTRAHDNKIGRFHSGAFEIARELGLDIVPMVIHGVGDYLNRDDFMIRQSSITLDILPRVKHAEFSNSEIPGYKVASTFRKLITESYGRIASEKEGIKYFSPLVKYKYAYRGWAIASRAKKTLKLMAKEREKIENFASDSPNIVIVNSGIGTFALMLALLKPEKEIYGAEESLSDHIVATVTAGLPKNLHYVHAVSAEEYSNLPVGTVIELSNPWHKGFTKPDLTLSIKS